MIISTFDYKALRGFLKTNTRAEAVAILQGFPEALQTLHECTRREARFLVEPLPVGVPFAMCQDQFFLICLKKELYKK